MTFEVRRFAEFASPLDLWDFPFDAQVLRIDVASTRYGPEEVELVVDDITSGRFGNLSIARWGIELGEITVSQIDLQGGERVVRIVLRIYAVANTEARAEEIVTLAVREPDVILRALA